MHLADETVPTSHCEIKAGSTQHTPLRGVSLDSVLRRAAFRSVLLDNTGIEVALPVPAVDVTSSAPDTQLGTLGTLLPQSACNTELRTAAACVLHIVDAV